MLEQFQNYRIEKIHSICGGHNQRPPSAPIFSSNTAGNISDDEDM